ncbi:MAG: hypothetical protein IJT49_05900 [Clostridia bacterium]|nr:hypothetical protein [Clostridia bacterium]
MKNNIFKKFCILALILCLISGHMTIFTSAEGEVSAPPVKVLEKYVDVAELRAYLFDAFKECTNDRIELSQFNIPLADEEKQALCDFIWRDMPESFHVDQLKFKNNGKIITAVLVESYRYAETKEQYAEMLSECEAKAAELLDGIKDNDKLGDAEKALLIHDRLAVRCNYCSDDTIDDRYTIYGALVRGVAVCDGYSRTYAYLLRLAGIENINCSSLGLNHSWNLVLIDGCYYHADVTWDDPICYTDTKKGHEGYVQHNFLLSDEARKAFIKSKGYTADKYNDYYNTLATSTKYDNYYWRASETEFQLIGDQLYYFDNAASTLNRVNEDKKSGTAVLKKADTWWASDRSYYWDDNFTRLGSNGEVLFLSTSDTVYLYNPKYDSLAEVFKPELKNGNQIYGFTFFKGCFVCDTGSVPTGESSADCVTITERYTPKKISVTLTCTNDTADSQTVTANIISENGISGYYFGTDPAYNKTDITSSTEATPSFNLDTPGVYYFAAYDAEGEVSEVSSLTLCAVELNASGEIVEYNRILAADGSEITLPVPEMDGYEFKGWKTADNITICYNKYTVKDNQQHSIILDTIWAKIKAEQAISGTVQTSAPQDSVFITVTLLDADGNVLESATPENGVFSFKKAGEAAFVEITAPGYVGKKFKAESFPGSDGGDIKLDLLGDMDDDTELNNKDVTGLFRFLSDPNNTYSDKADVNGDKENNNKDVVFLFRFLSDPTSSLITHSAIMYT